MNSNATSSEPPSGDGSDEALAAAALKDLTDSDTKLTFVLDPTSSRILKLDGPWKEFTNLTPSELIQNPLAWQNSVHAFYTAEAEIAWHILKRTGFVTRTIQATGRAGRLRNLRIAISYRTWGGRPIVAGSLVELEEVSDELALSSTIRSAIERAPIGFAVTDAQGYFLYLNREHLQMFRYDSFDELVGKPWSILYGEEAAEFILRDGMPIMQATGAWGGKVQAQRKDGSVFDQEIRLVALPSGGILCTSQNISTKTKLAQCLERSEEMLRLFLTTIREGVSIRSVTGEYEFVNAAIAPFLSADNASSHGPTELLSSPEPESKLPLEACRSERELRAYLDASDKRVARTGTAERFDFPMKRNGQNRTFDVEKVPLKVASDVTTHVCTLISDVTEFKKNGG